MQHFTKGLHLVVGLGFSTRIRGRQAHACDPYTFFTKMEELHHDLDIVKPDSIAHTTIESLSAT